MNGIGWQDAVAAVLVVAAFAYLVWRRRRKPQAAAPLVKLGRAPRRDGR